MPGYLSAEPSRFRVVDSTPLDTSSSEGNTNSAGELIFISERHRPQFA